MKKTISIIALGILSIASIGAVMSSSEWSEREDDHEDGVFRDAWLDSRADVHPAENQAYQSECGGCHFAYQPGLLPGKDWERIMDSLVEHYGDLSLIHISEPTRPKR